MDFFLKVKKSKILYYVLYRLRFDSDVHYEQHEAHEENKEHEPCTHRLFCGRNNFANVVGSSKTPLQGRCFSKCDQNCSLLLEKCFPPDRIAILYN